MVTTTMRWVTHARRLMACLVLVLLTGCANMYVDGSAPEIDASQLRKPESTHPVQVLFEFQTKGVPNAYATQYWKSKVLAQVNASGLFSAASESPAAGGALLSITLNNVPITDNAFAKGFVTGLTLGIAGSQASDGYLCVARYTDAAGAQPLVKQARHAIHTTLGASAAPRNATKAENAQDAVTTMTRQVVSNVLNDLSLDVSFK